MSIPIIVHTWLDLIQEKELRMRFVCKKKMELDDVNATISLRCLSDNAVYEYEIGTNTFYFDCPYKENPVTYWSPYTYLKWTCIYSIIYAFSLQNAFYPRFSHSSLSCLCFFNWRWHIASNGENFNQ